MSFPSAEACKGRSRRQSAQQPLLLAAVSHCLSCVSWQPSAVTPSRSWDSPTRCSLGTGSCLPATPPTKSHSSSREDGWSGTRCLKRHQRNNGRWRTGLWRDCIASCCCRVTDSTIMNSLAEENTQNAVFTNQTIFLDIAESVNQLSAALWVLNIFLLFRKSSTNMQSI